MAVTAFLYGYAAIALPGPVTSLVLPLVWLALLVVALHWFTRHPVAVVALPVVATLVWFAGVVATAAA